MPRHCLPIQGKDKSRSRPKCLKTGISVEGKVKKTKAGKDFDRLITLTGSLFYHSFVFWLLWELLGEVGFIIHKYIHTDTRCPRIL
jgi:hypothetical protein